MRPVRGSLTVAAQRSQSELLDLLDLTVVAIAAGSSSGFVKRMIPISFISLLRGRTMTFLTRAARDAKALEVGRQPLLQLRFVGWT